MPHFVIRYVWQTFTHSSLDTFLTVLFLLCEVSYIFNVNYDGKSAIYQ